MDWVNRVVLAGLIAVVAYCLLAAFAFIRYLAFHTHQVPPLVKGQRVLVVVAHPDDECMFFTPTILELKKKNAVHILCLSTGNYEGKGHIRRRELVHSALALGLPMGCAFVRDLPELQDGWKEWDADVVARTVEEFLNERRMDVVVTFDGYGVSGHPNHVSVNKGIRLLMQRHPDVISDTQFLQLVSVPLYRKYWSVLDFPFSIGGTHLFYGFFHDRVTAAMRAHASQWVWFRRLSVVFSRYSCINTLEPMQPAAGKRARRPGTAAAACPPASGAAAEAAGATTARPKTE